MAKYTVVSKPAAPMPKPAQVIVEIPETKKRQVDLANLSRQIDQQAAKARRALSDRDALIDELAQIKSDCTLELDVPAKLEVTEVAPVE